MYEEERKKYIQNIKQAKIKSREQRKCKETETKIKKKKTKLLSDNCDWEVEV